MDTFTRYSRKIRMTLLKAVTCICFICLLYIPKSQTAESIAMDTGYYDVYLNGAYMGSMNSSKDANAALVMARGRISADRGSLVYMKPDLEMVEQKRVFGTRKSVEDMAVIMYDALIGTHIDFNKTDAYTVRINDYTVTLATKEEIYYLVDYVKQKYDTNDEFNVRLAGNMDPSSNEFGVEIVKAKLGGSGASKILNIEDGDVEVNLTDNVIYEDGMLAMTFSDDIVVSRASVTPEIISTVEEALEEITKESEARTVYVVESGDTLSGISSRYGLSIAQLCSLNEGLSENGVIGVGDEIIITVPKPELSVITVQETTYEEEYKAPVQYIDDDTMYQGQYSEIQAGSAGYREVVAVVQFENGKESQRDIIKETLLVESVPRILRRGTATPPTFVKPLAGGVFTSGYGYRWGRLHKGVDWGVPTGTSVKASSGGTVIRSGWFSSYGICVDIRHPNGIVTRYAHLSRTLVRVGQTVVQNQRIALSGNTGNSTGPHLHFEIMVNGTAVNPYNYLQ